LSTAVAGVPAVRGLFLAKNDRCCEQEVTKRLGVRLPVGSVPIDRAEHSFYELEDTPWLLTAG
jgi:hypothetical protein